jgi:type I restriction enzyme S subunit
MNTDVVPTGWRTTTLGQVLRKSEGGGTPPRDVKEYWNGDIPWASVKDIVKGEGCEPEETITQAGLANSTSKLIPAGTNIFAARMGVGAVTRYPYPVAINQDLMALTPSLELDSAFLFYWLQSRQEAFVGLATGTTVKGIRKEVLIAYPILVPPLDEQQRIAEVLRSVDEGIAANRAAIDAARRALEALASEIVVEASDARPIADFGRVVTGGTPSPRNPELWDGELPFITPGDLDDECVSVRSAARRLNASAPHGARIIPANSVLVTCIGSTVGKVAISRGECATNQQINAICCDPELAGYVYLACLAAYDDIVAHAGKQAVPIINKTTFSSLSLPCFPREQMRAISKAVDALDDEREQSAAASDRLTKMKASLMSDLLSGRVRVPA